jgi:hypothetical protein
MSAMDYESIIRMAFSSKRDGRIGADAEIYNKMDRLHIEAVMKGRVADIKTNQEFIVAFSDIRTNLRAAIWQVLDRRDVKITSSQKKKLDTILESLNKTGFLDKELLDVIIQETDEILYKLGLRES